MKPTTKKPFAPAPHMNVLKDQLKEQRFNLITKVKALREKRQGLKGVKGSGRQWAELCAQIDEVQDKIDLLSKSLGLPVKVTNSAQSGSPHQINYDKSNPNLGQAVMDAHNGKSMGLTITVDKDGNLIPAEVNDSNKDGE